MQKPPLAEWLVGAFFRLWREQVYILRNNFCSGLAAIAKLANAGVMLNTLGALIGISIYKCWHVSLIALRHTALGHWAFGIGDADGGH